MLKYLSKNLVTILLIIGCIGLLFSQYKLKAAQADLTTEVKSYRSSSLLLRSVRLNDDRLIDSLTQANGHQIFLRMFNNGCKDCADSLLANANYLAGKYGQNKIAILMSTTFNQNDFEMYRRMNRYSLPNMFYSETVSKIDSLKSTYYFHTNRAHAHDAYAIFLPEPTEDVLANWQYLGLVQHFYN